MYTIDFHTHPVLQSFREALTGLGIDPIEDDGFPLPAWSIKDHRAFMEEAGIDYSIFSLPSPHIHNGDDAKSAAAARKINEELGAAVHHDPGHFGFTACLPLPYAEGSLSTRTGHARLRKMLLRARLPRFSNILQIRPGPFSI
ncbi:hypothetical protein [Scardovia wiggsiae]|uniref:hypothetical protein n=1 Tax=Scardovia wiggsiae TaxID=230143 RepID=UPI00374F4F0F